MRGGGELVGFYAKEPDLAAEFAKRFPQEGARQRGEILEDTSVAARRERVHSRRAGAARRPGDAARQGLHVRQAGHDDLEQLAEVRRCRRRRGASTRSCTASGSRTARPCKAGELVKAGAIGTGRPDHRPRAAPHEPEDAAGVVLRDGHGTAGILCDIALAPVRPVPVLHRLDRAEIVASQVGNVHHPQYPASRTSAT